MKIESFLMIISMLMVSQVQLVHADSSWTDFCADVNYYKNLVVNKMKNVAQETTSSLQPELPEIEVSSIDSGKVTLYTAPFWCAHGLHGFYHRIKNYKAAEQTKAEGLQKSTLVSRFSKYHPIQSMRSSNPIATIAIPKMSFIKIPVPKIPVIGSLTAAYLTGLATQVFFGKTDKE